MSTIGDVEGAVTALVPGAGPVAFGLKHIGLIVGALGCAALGIMLLFAKADARHWHKVSDQQTAVLAQTVANYRAAQDEATRLDKANVARVQNQQAAITEKVSHDYQADLAAARARADALRVRLAAQADQGHPDAASVSGTGTAASGPDAAAPADGFSVAERLTATEQAIQLAALQDWVKKQSAIDNTGLDPTPSH